MPEEKTSLVSHVAGLAGVACGASTQVALSITSSDLIAVIAIVEVALAITVILTALYASDKYSLRAFRLLLWTNTNRGPEQHPTPQSGTSSGCSLDSGYSQKH